MAKKKPPQAHIPFILEAAAVQLLEQHVALVKSEVKTTAADGSEQTTQEDAKDWADLCNHLKAVFKGHLEKGGSARSACALEAKEQSHAKTCFFED